MAYMSTNDKLDYLEEERKKIWDKIVLLQDLVDKKTSDYESAAKLSSEQASEFKNVSEQAKNAIGKNLEETYAKLEEIRTAYGTYADLNTKINEYSNSSKDNSALIKAIYEM